MLPCRKASQWATSCPPPTSLIPSTGCTPVQTLFSLMDPTHCLLHGWVWGALCSTSPCYSRQEYWSLHLGRGLFAKPRCVGSQLHRAWPPAWSELLKAPAKSFKLKWHVPPSSGETVVEAGKWNAKNIIALCLISNKWILLFLLSHSPSARFQSCCNLR